MFKILSTALFTATRTTEGKQPAARPISPWRLTLPRLTAFPDA
ncbi:hypothetical protein [Vannielia litorea]|nr:hypothetical protein [Vannielia litorea]